MIEAMACGLPVVTTRVSVLPARGRGMRVLIDADAGGRRRSRSRTPARRSAIRGAFERRRATAERYSLEEWRDAIARGCAPPGNLRSND